MEIKSSLNKPANFYFEKTFKNITPHKTSKYIKRFKGKGPTTSEAVALYQRSKLLEDPVEKLLSF